MRCEVGFTLWDGYWLVRGIADLAWCADPGLVLMATMCLLVVRCAGCPRLSARASGETDGVDEELWPELGSIGFIGNGLICVVSAVEVVGCRN